jgi:hypothetical protein
MTLAGQLKNIPYKKTGCKDRPLTTGDAVMLAASLYIEEAMEVKL